MDNQSLALVLARPGRLRDGWRALLLATAQIERVSVADDVPAALCKVRAEKPALVLLDVEAFNGEAWALLKQIKVEHPQCRCLVLTPDSQLPQAARATGADAVLIKGFPAVVLFEAVRQLLPEPSRG